MKNVNKNLNQLRPRVAIIGDHIEDVVFPAESKQTASWPKGTAHTTGDEWQNQIRGPGGVMFLQQLFKSLLKTHARLSQKEIDANVIACEPPSTETRLNCITHWTAARCRRDYSGEDISVYRAIEKNGSQNPALTRDDMPKLCFPTNFNSELPPSLILIADYNRWTRIRPEWDQPVYKRWLTSPGPSADVPARIILLGNCLPKQVYNLPGQETMWDILFREDADPLSTLVVTSVDRLRQEGANISKRVSWDATLLSFQAELEQFAPLKRLASKCQLIVRFGVVGAIYCRPVTGGKIEMQFFYDPSPRQEFFRDRALQGHAFAIRGVVPACVALHLYLHLSGNKEKQYAAVLGEFDNPIEMGIHDGISALQRIYTAGFGPNLNTLREYVTNRNNYRIESLADSLNKAHKALVAYAQKDNNIPPSSDVKSLNYPWFVHKIRPPELSDIPPTPTIVKEWTLLRNNLRAMINPSDLIVYAPGEDRKIVQKSVEALEDLNRLEELRCLRMARAIVMCGADRALNNVRVPTQLQENSKHNTADHLAKVLNEEIAIDRAFRERVIGEINVDGVHKLILPELEGKAFPLNAPIGRFGRMSVMGRADIESLGSIRNLISAHLASSDLPKRSQAPLSLAAFGAPGSGKSFGIKEMAMALGGAKISIYECNLSQLSDRHDLNREFFNVFQIILKGKIPLVIFDEFDAKQQSDPLGWLKFFLEPMNDGRFRHSDGIGEMSNALLVFCGGTSRTFDEFATKNSNVTDAKVADFISRLHGIINVEGLDKDIDGRIPYLRRALLLRSLIEGSGDLISQDNTAQIDRNIIDAFLRVKSYKHGARSMKSVLGMFMRWNRSLQKVSVPTQRQLDLHTDGEDFLKLISSRHAPISSVRGSEAK